MRRYLFYISQLYSFSILRPLQKMIISRGDDAAWFLVKPDKLSPYLRSNEKWLKTVNEVKMYDPSAVFAPGNVLPDFFPGVKVQIFHGFDTHKRDDRKGHFRIRNLFDLYCTQGSETTEPFEKLAQRYRSFEVVETGWPKMDPLFDNTSQISNSESRIPKQPVILFTSTFTPRLSAAPALFAEIQRLAKSGKWKWIVNFHPMMDYSVVEKYRSIQSDNLKYIETDDIIPLLKKADIMVSDTSSVLSEILLLYKPVVTFKNRRPGPYLLNITDTEELESTIEIALTQPELLIQEIKSYADRIHPYRDGCSSLRVLSATDDLIDRGRDHLKRKPFNLIRWLKIRQRLRYYWF